MTQHPENDWIEWAGGECPVGVDTLVEINCRDGHSSVNPASHADTLWRHSLTCHPEWDIIAYRVVHA